MYRSEVIYYGPPGLAADVFEKAMTNLGFWVDRAFQSSDLLNEVGSHPTAITVIATEWSSQELPSLLRQIRMLQGDRHTPIFVIGAADRVQGHWDEVRFVPIAQRLRGTVNGIGDYIRRSGRGALGTRHA